MFRVFGVVLSLFMTIGSVSTPPTQYAFIN